jgi:hypothetical protein
VFVVIALLWVIFDRVYPPPKRQTDALAEGTSASAYHE